MSKDVQTRSLNSLVSEQLELDRILLESGGEITPEIDSRIRDLEMHMPSKIDAYAIMDDRSENEEMYWKQKANECLKMAKAYNTIRERLRGNLKVAIISLNQTEAIGEMYKFRLSGSAPRLVIENEADVPSMYKVVVQEIKIERDKIKADLIEGIEVPGCKLEPVFALRITKSKGIK